MKHGIDLTLTSTRVSIETAGRYDYFMGCPPNEIDPARKADGGVFTGLGAGPARRTENLILLERLALEMCQTRRAGRKNTSIPAGYTYLGQLIAHDLTFSASRLPQGAMRPRETGNLATAFLDLDCIYGGGPEKSPYLYETEASIGSGSRKPSRKRLRVGLTRPRNPQSPSDVGKVSPDDLPRVCPFAPGGNLVGQAGREADRETLIADPRNEDNLILAQLVVLFHKLHNKIVDRLMTDEFEVADADVFATARRVVLSVYRDVVARDFLQRVLDRDILRQYGKKRTPDDFRILGSRVRAGSAFSLPVEFSVAALRFGHAMVQQSYFFNRAHRDKISVGELSGFQNDAPRTNTPIDHTWVIDWTGFFPDAGAVPEGAIVNHSAPIGPNVADHFGSVIFAPGEGHRHPAPLRGGLLYRDLARAYDMRIANGQYFAVQLARTGGLTFRALTREELLDGIPGTAEGLARPGRDNPLLEVEPESGRTYAEILSDDTPLLYYLLQEAAVINGGERLGPVGSAILAEVLLSGIRLTELEEDGPSKRLRYKVFGAATSVPSTMPELIRFVDPDAYTPTT